MNTTKYKPLFEGSSGAYQYVNRESPDQMFYNSLNNVYRVQAIRKFNILPGLLFIIVYSV